SRSLKVTRRVLPEIVFGSSSINSIFLGYLYGAVSFLLNFCKVVINGRSSSSETGSYKTTYALTNCPRTGSGLATTAQSLTSGCFNNTSSTSNGPIVRSEEHTSELQSRFDLVCRLLLEKKKKHKTHKNIRQN